MELQVCLSRSPAANRIMNSFLNDVCMYSLNTYTNRVNANIYIYILHISSPTRSKPQNFRFLGCLWGGGKNPTQFQLVIMINIPKFGIHLRGMYVITEYNLYVCTQCCFYVKYRFSGRRKVWALFLQISSMRL